MFQRSPAPAHGAPGALEVPHGTTIVALVFDGGVVDASVLDDVVRARLS